MMDQQQESQELNFMQDILSEEEMNSLLEIQKESIRSYVAAKDRMTEKEWLIQEFQKQLPDKTLDEIKSISDEIITSLKTTEEKKESQRKAIAAGRSKESWLASSLLQSVSYLSTQERVKYLQNLDDAIKNANEAMYKTIMTKKSGYSIPNKNPNLDGYIAEQYHVNTFNLNAAAKKSGLRAEVQPLKAGKTYSKNGFDVVIKDAKGKRIHQYQMKYGASSKETIQYLKAGNYKNQKLVVPKKQVQAVKKAFPNKTVSSTIGDGDIQGRTLTKLQAKKLQAKAQKGNIPQHGWNDYVAKDIAIGIGKEVGYASLTGAAVGAGVVVATKALNGEKIDEEAVVEAALVSGADFGVKTATAGALRIAAEKSVLPALPVGIENVTWANVAFIAVENAKIFSKVATGELTLKEGFNMAEQTTCACVAGISASLKGAKIGQKIGESVGIVFGMPGKVIGGFIGGAIGYMAGSEFGKTVVKGAQKVRDKAVEVVKSVGSAIASGVKAVGRGLAGLLGF